MRLPEVYKDGRQDVPETTGEPSALRIPKWM